MDCNDFLQRYSDYDDSLLSPEDTEAFRRHLAGCSSCARYDRVLRKGRMVVRQAARPSPSDEFLPMLNRRLRADRARSAGPSAGLSAGSRWGFQGTRFSGAPGSMAAGGFLTLALTAVLAVWVVGTPAASTAATGQLHVHQDAPTNLRAVLPPIAHVDPMDWTVTRVDHSGGSSYSPLVTGPPAYGARRVTFTSPSPPIRSTLD